MIRSNRVLFGVHDMTANADRSTPRPPLGVQQIALRPYRHGDNETCCAISRSACGSTTTPVYTGFAHGTIAVHRRVAEMPLPCVDADGVSRLAPVGHAIVHQRRDTYVLAHVAVMPFAQRCGVGRALANEWCETANDQRMRLIALVPERELSAQLWLKAIGWRCVHSLEPLDGGGNCVLQFKPIGVPPVIIRISGGPA